MTAPWQLQAACRPGSGHDPNLWFPNPGDIHIRNTALAICATCPVQQQCAQQALRTGEPDGIWGGLTPRQRTRLGANQKPRRQAHCGTPAGCKAHYRAGETPCHACRTVENRYRQDRYARAKATP